MGSSRSKFGTYSLYVDNLLGLNVLFMEMTVQIENDLKRMACQSIGKCYKIAPVIASFHLVQVTKLVFIKQSVHVVTISS